MFKNKKLSAIVALLVMLVPTIVYGQTSNVQIDKGQLYNGIVSISYQSPQNKSSKVMISKGNEKYTYDLNSKGQFPLQFGNGDYTVSVLENVESNKYRMVTSEKLNLETANQKAVYLQSIDMINWNNDMKAIKKAKEITQNAKSNKEKATIIYDFVTQKIKYDHQQAKTVQAGYIPAVDVTMNRGQGICFDYSVLYAAMMRSVGVPTKVMMGYNKDIADYHAWNEVYLEDSQQWVIIDTTYDAPSVQAGITMSMIKNKDDYKIEKKY